MSDVVTGSMLPTRFDTRASLAPLLEPLVPATIAPVSSALTQERQYARSPVPFVEYDGGSRFGRPRRLDRLADAWQDRFRRPRPHGHRDGGKPCGRGVSCHRLCASSGTDR